MQPLKPLYHALLYWLNQSGQDDLKNKTLYSKGGWKVKSTRIIDFYGSDNMRPLQKLFK